MSLSMSVTYFYVQTSYLANMNAETLKNFYFLQVEYDME